MRKLLFTITIIAALHTQGQVISRFTWASTPLTTAAQGPNGLSISASATNSNVGGSIGWALNPGLPTSNVDLVLPGSPYFDVSSIDISLYFRREESVASFFKRGSYFDFGSNGGYLIVKFTTTRGSTPGDTTINSGNIAAIANDHAFHNYRFRYDNNTGIARVLVDGVVVYTYNGVAGRPLSWTGMGNVIIGENMDATSTNITVLANLTVQLYNASLLPLNILSFGAQEKNNTSRISWKVTEETDVAHFVVEKSVDNIHYSQAGQINPSARKEYSFVDELPANGINYYRLRIIDKAGYSTFSDTRQVRVNAERLGIKCFPNPATDRITIAATDGQLHEYSLLDFRGNLVKTGNFTGQTTLDLNAAIAAGTYVLKVSNKQTATVSSLVVVKK